MQNSPLTNHKLFRFGIILLFILPLSIEVSAQAVPDTLQTAIRDTIPSAVTDTIPRPAERDTTLIQDAREAAPGDTTTQSPQNRQADQLSDPEAVNFQAQDSLTFKFGEQRIANLYGSSNVKHTNGELSAGEIQLDLNLNQVEARAENPQDTLSYPVLRRQQDEIRSTRVLFNYETERGKFEVAEIEVDDGYLIGKKLRMYPAVKYLLKRGFTQLARPIICTTTSRQTV